jgi:chemotaxis protein methyltransferase CheR
MQTSDEMVQFFAGYIRKEVGIIYQEANLYQLETRLKEIAQQLEFETVADLYTSAKRRITAEMRLFILDIATNNETSFYRDPHVFEGVSEVALNFIDQLKQNGNQKLRIWSAACSRGQEIYTLAMCLDPLEVKLPNGFSILATDISERALDQAKLGKYSQLQIQRGLPIQKLLKYFKKEDNESKYDWGVQSDIRRNISFKSQNLLDPFTSLGNFHIILMRNVLIYQTMEKRKQILESAFEHLEPGGYIVMGSAESMIGITDIYESEKVGKAQFFRKPLVENKKSA